VEDNEEAVFVGGGGGVDGDDVLVLAEEQALELVVAVLPSLGVNLLLDERLGDLLASKRVEHALFQLDHSFDDIVFVKEINVAESSLSGLFQA